MKNIFKEEYFDNNDYSLTKNDIWLLKFCDNWIVEIPSISDVTNEKKYTEITGEENIRQIFDISPRKDFLNDISEFGYRKICEFENKEKNFIFSRKKIVNYIKENNLRHYKILNKK